ncbi:MAG: glycosyltransferase [Anaerolineae bacterium]
MSLKLSVIIPCYSEKSTIEEIVAAVKAVGVAWEIIIVDDGSSDGDILKQWGNDPMVRDPADHNQGWARRCVPDSRTPKARCS